LRELSQILARFSRWRKGGGLVHFGWLQASETRAKGKEVDALSNPSLEDNKKKVRDSRRVFDYKGYKVAVCLTIDTINQLNEWAWHFSVCDGSTPYPRALPDEIVKEIVKVFLPDGVEIPSFLHPGKLRQFLKIVRER
jgi:hypothetical protein